MARALIIASLAGLALAPAATAQNALGDGTALDANQQVGAGRVNRPGHSLEDELRFRNAIVTGNAPGGLSFRGDVGYTAPFEFRGGLGSDTLFTFRRDSFYSGLAGMGIRGAEGLQYQFALTTGNEPPPGLRGSLIASRTGMDPLPVAPPRFTPDGEFEGAGRLDLEPAGGGAVDLRPLDEASPLADPRGQALWTLRSPAAYDAERRLDPSMLTVLTGQDGQSYGLTASPLRSVSIETLTRQGAQPEAEQEAPEGRLDTSIPAERFETYISEREPPQPAGPGEQGAQEQDPAQQHITSWRRMLDEISAQLQAAQAEAPEAPAGQPQQPDVEDPLQARRETLERLLDERTIEALRESQGEYETLWRPSARDFDAYTTHMRAGESLLAEARYFEAEERFTRALAAKPGDPLAAAGRVHAELGAGLFASAALNLRELLTKHPEIIGARYQARLLPQPQRIGNVLMRLRASIERGGERGDHNSALLLAYLGFQTDDRMALTEGLEQMRAAGDTALATVLGRIWQEGRRAPQEDAPQEDAPQEDAGQDAGDDQP